MLRTVSKRSRGVGPRSTRLLAGPVVQDAAANTHSSATEASTDPTWLRTIRLRGSKGQRIRSAWSRCMDASCHELPRSRARLRERSLARASATNAAGSNRCLRAATPAPSYGLKRHWRDGTSAVSFDPLTFIERLAALVPPPRAHQLTYHGVLAPASAWRDLVVPKRAPASTSPSCGPLAPNSPTAPSNSVRSRSSRSIWAELLRRVFAVDVLSCPHCGGPRRLIAQLTDPVVVHKVLPYIGHPTGPPRPAPARSREQLDFASLDG